jgi:hypothetical protein
MSDRSAALIDTISRSMMDLQTPPSGSLGAQLGQHEDAQLSEGQSYSFR